MTSREQSWRNIRNITLSNHILSCRHATNAVDWTFQDKDPPRSMTSREQSWRNIRNIRNMDNHWGSAKILASCWNLKQSKSPSFWSKKIPAMDAIETESRWKPPWETMGYGTGRVYPVSAQANDEITKQEPPQPHVGQANDRLPLPKATSWLSAAASWWSWADGSKRWSQSLP